MGDIIRPTAVSELARPEAPERITERRPKLAAYLAICVAFVAISVAILLNPSLGRNPAVMWFLLSCFGPGAVLIGWLQIRPQVLLLDADGFTLGGGLVRSPRKILWRDVERFFVFNLGRGGTMVGFNYVPGCAPDTPLARMSHRLGADGGLPKGWAMSS